ncbi:uncharacterized protein BDZ99DRAFT_159659 [Mytilinidion resinicola]|uniref:Polyprenol reductase n=1 Tax=Mytilinidion resinicola TaxID=574789 RepID=A0A6A6Y809_9PEZI|nr:uncharacterized protein BDZ99DRAFT_159659 [Mytilinidion resinicola]KAF2804104.1 hypothetical protein BDZ99DRAFT_159659 [Mytilinidion resinicola]
MTVTGVFGVCFSLAFGYETFSPFPSSPMVSSEGGESKGLKKIEQSFLAWGYSGGEGSPLPIASIPHTNYSFLFLLVRLFHNVFITLWQALMLHGCELLQGHLGFAYFFFFLFLSDIMAWRSWRRLLDER